MKIIELFIDPNSDDIDEGVGGIALVDKPAHESNFLTFSEETIVDDKAIEYTYIGEMFNQDQQLQLAKLINTLGEPTGTLEREGWEIYSIEECGTLEQERKFNKFYNIISNPNERSGEDALGALRVRYKYIGPKDDKNRQFCSDMLAYKRVFRIEDIEQMTNECTNEEFGCYDIFTWRGSYNCRHKWVKVLYRPSGAITGNIRPLQTDDITQESTLNRATANKRGSFNYEFGILDIIDGQPVFETPEDALKLAEILGCEGYHEMPYGDTIGYMACYTHEFQSYTDYPQAATDNACKVLRWIDEYGRDEVPGMTQTGLARANQLCNKEPISVDTISRMAAFARHRQNADISDEYKGTPWKDNGYVAWLGWGGTEGVDWAIRKMEQLRQEMGLEEACWPGYEAIGTKIKDGKEVPNCVPKQKMEEDECVSFDYHDTLNTDKGKNAFMLEKERGSTIYVISAAQDKNDLLTLTRELGINDDMVFATGSNKAKVEKIRSLSCIVRHYDNNADVIEQLGSMGVKMGNLSGLGGGCGCMEINTTGLPTYVDQITTGVTSESVFKYGFSYDDEKMEITGAAIIPNKMIIRRNPITDELYYVFFSPETTKILSERFMKFKLTDNANLNHTNVKAEDTYVSESWLVIDPQNDKSAALGLNYPEGTWVITMKVNNNNLWEDIKSGKYKGYSIEGYFNERMVFN